MDQSNNSSSLFNESDLRLSTSLCQWAGFELDCQAQETPGSEYHSGNAVVMNANESNMDPRGSSASCYSPEKKEENQDDMLGIVREFLLEKTSQFYNDIIDAQSDKLDKTGFTLENLRKRYESLRNQTASVFERFHISGIEEELNNRLKSIDAALRQLSVMKAPISGTLSLSSSDSGRSSTDDLGFTTTDPLRHWRRWIESVEAKIIHLRQQIDWYDREVLEQRLEEQQALQIQIEHEGGHWATVVQKFIDSLPSSHRRKIILTTIERRWHGLWIKSLEWQCRLERQIRFLLLGIMDTSKDDFDTGEPLIKRRRLNDNLPDDDGDTDGQLLLPREDDPCSDEVCSATSDTIPFSENEYEPLTPRSLPPSHQEEEPISARDGGYSSGSSMIAARLDMERITDENGNPRTILEDYTVSPGSPPCLERRTRIENSPVKCFYKMTSAASDDPPDLDSPRPVETSKAAIRNLPDDALYVYTQPYVAPPAELTDSLFVNVGDTVSEIFDTVNNGNNADDLEEILNLFRQGDDDHDTFEFELQELLLRRQGTVWVPISHDEKIEDEPREDTPTAELETPPATPYALPSLPRGKSFGSLKRRYSGNARLASNSSTLPTDLTNSDIGIMSQSLDNALSPWSPNLDGIDSSGYALATSSAKPERKKLRAFRLRRSWSCSVQKAEVGLPSRRLIAETVGLYDQNSPIRPNTAVSIADEDSRNASESIGLACGSSIQSIEDCDDVMIGGGETMAEDELDGETVPEILRPPVWEWDDYKPPKHHENGLDDEPIVGEPNLTDWDDDGLDQDSTRTPSARTGYTTASDASSISPHKRLSPIGESRGPTSALDECRRIADGSHFQLRSAQPSFKRRQKQFESPNPDPMSTYEKNVREIENLIGGGRQADTKTPSTRAKKRRCVAESDDRPPGTAEEKKRRTSIARRLIRYWPVQLCLLGLLLLNVFLFYPSCCDQMNRYWWSLSPKTHYSHGPPPT